VVDTFRLVVHSLCPQAPGDNRAGILLPMEPAPADPPPVSAEWFPRPVETGVSAVCGLLALGLALVAGDAVGLFLFGVAGFGLLVVAGADLLLRPRLAADREGVRVRTLSGSRRLPWPSLERVDVDELNRFGLASRALELEAAGQLIVLSRRTLGTDPREVADTLARIRYTS
jgi:hypothetical protein